MTCGIDDNSFPEWAKLIHYFDIIDALLKRRAESQRSPDPQHKNKFVNLFSCEWIGMVMCMFICFTTYFSNVNCAINFFLLWLLCYLLFCIVKFLLFSFSLLWIFVLFKFLLWILCYLCFYRGNLYYMNFSFETFLLTEWINQMLSLVFGVIWIWIHQANAIFDQNINSI